MNARWLDNGAIGKLRRGCEKRPLPEDDFCIVVRCERLVNSIWLHVEATARAVEEASPTWAFCLDPGNTTPCYAMTR